MFASFRSVSSCRLALVRIHAMNREAALLIASNEFLERAFRVETCDRNGRLQRFNLRKSPFEV